MKNLLLLAALSTMLLACTLPGSETRDKTSVTLRFAAPRTVSVDWAALVTSYSVVLTNTDGQNLASIGPVSPSPANSTSFTIAGVKPGVWTIAVTARDAGTNVVATGQVSATLPSGVSIAVPLTATPAQIGTGSFSYPINYPDSVGITAVTGVLKYAQVSGQTAGTTHSSPTPTVVPGAGTTTATFAAAGLTSGSYRLFLTFYRGATAARSSVEAINIYDSRVSDQWLDFAGVPHLVQTFSATDFNDTNAQLADLTATVDATPITLGAGFSSATLSYANTASSPTATQVLRFTPTQAQPGQMIEWSTDGTTWAALSSGTQSGTITLSQGAPLTLSVRVTATDLTTQKTYTLDFTKTVPVSSVTLGANPAAIATDNFSTSWTATVIPAFADNQIITWTSSNTAVADIDVNTGLITPHVPGTVTITATSQDGSFTAQAPLTLTPSAWELKATKNGGIWTTIVSVSAPPPPNLVSIFGGSSSLFAFDTSGTIYEFSGVKWLPVGFSAPAGTLAMAMSGGGTLAAATPASIFLFQDGIWTAQPGSVPAFKAMSFGNNAIRLLGTNDQFYSSAGGFWPPDGFAAPTGTTAIAGDDNGMIARVGSQLYDWSGVWTPLPATLTLPPQSVGITFALDQLVVLIEK